MAQNVSDFFWQRLHTWGVRRVFGQPGDGTEEGGVILEAAKQVLGNILPGHRTS